jgi:hypothetical protein
VTWKYVDVSFISEFRGEKRFKRALATMGMAVVALVAFGQAANAAGPSPFDPSPYCRPYVGLPYVDGQAQAGSQAYSFDVEAAGGMTCNGSAHIVSVSITLHYSTTSGGGSGSTTGSTHTCGGSCEATAHKLRTPLYCGETYQYNDYAVVNYTWQQTTSSSTISGSLTGGHSAGSSYNPSPWC